MTNVHADAEGSILTLRVDIAEATKELTRQVEHWQQTAERTRKQWEESEWYLGEARVCCTQLEEQLQALRGAYNQSEASHREVTVRLQEAERQRNEVNWALSELRVAYHGLRQQAQQFTEQLIQAHDELADVRRLMEELEEHVRVERDRREVIEAELTAVQTYGERRRALRNHRTDVMAELRAGDGTVLFRGLPRDVSRMGLGFASEDPIHYLVDPLQIRLHFSGGLRPVDGIGRLVWQRQETRTAQYLAGCEFLDVPAEVHESLAQALASPVGVSMGR